MVLFLSGFSLSVRCWVSQQPPYFGHRAISPNGGARVVWNLEQFQGETWEWCRALLRHERDNLFVMSFNLASEVSVLRVIYLKASANVCWKNGETLEKTLESFLKDRSCWNGHNERSDYYFKFCFAKLKRFLWYSWVFCGICRWKFAIVHIIPYLCAHN